MLWSELAALACTLILLANAMCRRPQLWLIYLVAALAVSAGSMQRPSLDAMLPRYVPHGGTSRGRSMINNQCYGLARILGTVAGGVLASADVPLGLRPRWPEFPIVIAGLSAP